MGLTTIAIGCAMVALVAFEVVLVDWALHSSDRERTASLVDSNADTNVARSVSRIRSAASIVVPPALNVKLARDTAWQPADGPLVPASAPTDPTSLEPEPVESTSFRQSADRATTDAVQPAREPTVLRMGAEGFLRWAIANGKLIQPIAVDAQESTQPPATTQTWTTTDDQTLRPVATTASADAQEPPATTQTWTTTDDQPIQTTSTTVVDVQIQTEPPVTTPTSTTTDDQIVQSTTTTTASVDVQIQTQPSVTSDMSSTEPQASRGERDDTGSKDSGSAPDVDNGDEDDEDELLEPWYVRKIKRENADPLHPMQVHLVWVGDLNNAPETRIQYTLTGYNLTEHTSAEEILDGFHPHVLKAYKQAIPNVVGYDFLNLALLYKHGGMSVDADTYPLMFEADLKFPSGCDVVFGKENDPLEGWERPIYREKGGATYGFNRPFQILAWATAAAKPRSKHVLWIMKVAMAHFFGLRDMENRFVQDISGSGIMTDYVAMLHEKAGRSYPEVFKDDTNYIPVEGLCLTRGLLENGWIKHSFLGSWK